MSLEAERRHTFEEVRLHKNHSSSLWKIINRAIPSKDKERPAYTKKPDSCSQRIQSVFCKVGKNAADASRHLPEENSVIIREP